MTQEELKEKVWENAKDIAVLKNSNQITNKRLSNIEADIGKAKYWFIGLLLTIIGTFIMDKFF